MNQKVLFKHCDPAGIVFYPRYFEMINDCVEAFFAECGTPFEVLLKSAGVPTVQIAATFTAPSRHGDQLVLALDVLRIGASSLDLEINADADAGAARRFTANSTLVYLGVAGRPTKWPDALRLSFTSHLRSTP
ncbi:acyl-CoA thioesterase [Sulfitobacter guttiformis]|nr:acyl-CoA thioesterase [Sulfitobacter guttiformis]